MKTRSFRFRALLKTPPSWIKRAGKKSKFIWLYSFRFDMCGSFLVGSDLVSLLEENSPRMTVKEKASSSAKKSNKENSECKMSAV